VGQLTNHSTLCGNVTLGMGNQASNKNAAVDSVISEHINPAVLPDENKSGHGQMRLVRVCAPPLALLATSNLHTRASSRKLIQDP